MKEFITSDLHFGHANIMKFCPKTRPYSSVSEMDELMIRDWNALVGAEDHVFILGDVSFHQASKTNQILDRLNGKLILVAGNHDNKLLKDVKFRARFIEIHNYLEITRSKRHIVMFHYPILRWNRSGHGSVHFHGHSHGSPTGLEDLRCMDVGYDATGHIVMELDRLVEKLSQKEKASHHGS